MVLRIGVIGTGAIGRDHARRINQVLAGAKIVALNDVHRHSAEAVKSSIAPDAIVFDTGEELIDSADVDAVLITSLGQPTNTMRSVSSLRENPASARSRSPIPRKGRDGS